MSLILAVNISLSITAYGTDLPSKCSLRKPLDFNDDKMPAAYSHTMVVLAIKEGICTGYEKINNKDPRQVNSSILVMKSKYPQVKIYF